HDIDISSSHALLYFDMEFSIGEMIQLASAQGTAKPISYELCQFWGGRTAVDIQVWRYSLFVHSLSCCCFCSDHTTAYPLGSLAFSLLHDPRPLWVPYAIKAKPLRLASSVFVFFDAVRTDPRGVKTVF